MAELLFQSRQETIATGEPIVITKILGAIDGTTVRQFEEKLIGFFDQGIKNLILIFSEVKYINSTGMGLLVKIADKFQEGGGDIKLVGVPDKVTALFDMLGLLSLFKIYDTEAEAMQAVGGAGAAPAAAPSRPITRQSPVAPPPPPPPPPRQVASPSRMAPMRPAPAMTPTPVPSMGMDSGEEITPMVVEISPEPETPQAVSWPLQTTCTICNGAIEFAAPGRYQCPRCRSFLSVAQNGMIDAHQPFNANTIEMKLPCAPEFAVALKSVVNSMAQRVHFSQLFCDEINTAIDTAFQIMLEKTNNNYDFFQTLIIADNNEMIMGIKAFCSFLNQKGPKDPRLQLIARKVNKLEVFPLPNTGQLLKITKNRK